MIGESWRRWCSLRWLGLVYEEQHSQNVEAVWRRQQHLLMESPEPAQVRQVDELEVAQNQITPVLGFPEFVLSENRSVKGPARSEINGGRSKAWTLSLTK